MALALEAAACCCWTSRPPAWAIRRHYDITRTDPTAAQGSASLRSLLIEHDMRVVFHLADRITVLAEGGSSREGTPERDRSPTNECKRPTSGKPHETSSKLQSCKHITAEPHLARRIASTVAEGEVIALLGRNGAGKTTTLRTLVGLTPAAPGIAVTIFGSEITALAAVSHRGARCRLRPRGAQQIFANLTVE